MTVLRTAFAWHRPLMALAAANAVLVPLGLIGLLADPRVVTGMPVWAKPTKFAASMVIYGVTWAWLYARTRERSTRPPRGLHAAGTLQALPLLVIALELLARRVPALSSAAVRHRLTAVGSVAFTAVLALLTWQALRGQSIVTPDATTVAAFGALVAVTALATRWAVRPAEPAVVVRPAAGAPS